jgi:uncharacterized membrane protein YdbT with pleckstrin-like domain
MSDMAFWRAPSVDAQLLPDEHVVDDVRKVWVAFVGPTLIIVVAVVLLLWSLAAVPVRSLWVGLVVGVLLLGFGVDRYLNVFKDRLIITDSRVMRVSGVYSRKAAWMPLSRVLDITVDRPLWLRPIRAGHLTLENAAQEQGLREFRFIPHPNERALRIHALRTGGPGPSVPPQVPTTGARPNHPPLGRVRRDGHHLT